MQAFSLYGGIQFFPRLFLVITIHIFQRTSDPVTIDESFSILLFFISHYSLFLYCRVKK